MMFLYKIILILTYKYKKTYWIVADSPTEARMIAENAYNKKFKNVIAAPTILDVNFREYELKKGIIDV